MRSEAPDGLYLQPQLRLTRPEPAWQNMAQPPLNGATKPVDSEEEGRSSTTDIQWPKQIKEGYRKFYPDRRSKFHVLTSIVFILLSNVGNSFIVICLSNSTSLTFRTGVEPLNDLQGKITRIIEEGRRLIDL